MTEFEYESNEVFYPPGEMPAGEDVLPAVFTDDEEAALMLNCADLDESSSEETAEAAPPVVEEEPPPKPKRTRRKKAAPEPEPEAAVEPAAEPEESTDEDMGLPADIPGATLVPKDEIPEMPPTPVRRSATYSGPEREFLTIQVGDEVETEEAHEDYVWHEIRNAYLTRRILTGPLSGVEQTEGGKTIAIVDYKGFRILIPLKEMMLLVNSSSDSQQYGDIIQRQIRFLNNMLGAEIDFIVRGIDANTRSVVASRKDAMLKKRQTFYLDINSTGRTHIYEGRVVQARVVAVAEKSVRVEVFGVECSIIARDMAWHWIGDAHDKYAVGDDVLVRVLNIRGETPEEIRIKADFRSLSENNNLENLRKCKLQCRYAGKVTDVRKGVVYIRLANGANAVAHSCFDYRRPGKKDDVSFAVTRLDEEQGVAVGIITRIIRQNI